MRRKVEYCLIVAGLSCIALCAGSFFRYQVFQQHAQVLLSEPQKPLTYTSLSKSGGPTVIGSILIRRLALQIAVVEGDDDEDLALGAGHMPGTALPGQPGNVVIAGHRDSSFWPLRNIREGDRIEIAGQKTSMYRVQHVQIVQADDVRLLADTPEPILTLVTCYPFRHVGLAPERFVVQAKLVTNSKRNGE